MLQYWKSVVGRLSEAVEVYNTARIFHCFAVQNTCRILCWSYMLLYCFYWAIISEGHLFLGCYFIVILFWLLYGLSQKHGLQSSKHCVLWKNSHITPHLSLQIGTLSRSVGSKVQNFLCVQNIQSASKSHVGEQCSKQLRGEQFYLEVVLLRGQAGWVSHLTRNTEWEAHHDSRCRSHTGHPSADCESSWRYGNTTVYYRIHESSECIPVDCGVTNLIHDRRSCADFTLEVEANVARCVHSSVNKPGVKRNSGLWDVSQL